MYRFSRDHKGIMLLSVTKLLLYPRHPLVFQAHFIFKNNLCKHPYGETAYSQWTESKSAG